MIDSTDAMWSTTDDARRRREVDEQFDEVGGLGETYAKRLNEAGIDSMEALADAQSDAVAEAAEVTEEQAQEWIDEAGR